MNKWIIVVMAFVSAAFAGESGKRLPILDCGAVGDAVTLNTKPIQTAIDQLASGGGGTVIIPKGVFLSGALFLKPGMNLHMEKESVIKGSTDMTQYPVRRIRIEGHFEAAYTPALINAEGCDGLQLTGEGTLDGSGRPTWDLFWKLRNAAADKKKFKNLSIPRAQLCIINDSKNVLVDGITFKGCYFSVTDDCIAMKGSKGPDALNDKDSPPVERVRISDCTFKRGGVYD